MQQTLHGRSLCEGRICVILSPNMSFGNTSLFQPFFVMLLVWLYTTKELENPPKSGQLSKNSTPTKLLGIKLLTNSLATLRYRFGALLMLAKTLILLDQ